MRGGGVGAFEGPAVLLAAGEAKAALLSPASGRREQTVLLPAAPALPLWWRGVRLARTAALTRTPHGAACAHAHAARRCQPRS